MNTFKKIKTPDENAFDADLKKLNHAQESLLYELLPEAKLSEIEGHAEWVDHIKELFVFDYVADQVVKDFKRLQGMSTQAILKTREQLKSNYITSPPVSASNSSPAVTQNETLKALKVEADVMTFGRALDAVAHKTEAEEAFRKLLLKIIEKRTTLIEAILTQAKEQFKARLEFLQSEWETNPPSSVSLPRAEKMKALIERTLTIVENFDTVGASQFALDGDTSNHKASDFERYLSHKPFDDLHKANETIANLEANYVHLFDVDDWVNQTKPMTLIHDYKETSNHVMAKMKEHESEFFNKHHNLLLPKGRKIIETRLSAMGLSMSYQEVIARALDHDQKKAQIKKLKNDSSNVAKQAEAKKMQEELDKENEDFQSSADISWGQFLKDFVQPHIELEKNIHEWRLNKWIMGYDPDSFERKVHLYEEGDRVNMSEEKLQEESLDGLKSFFNHPDVNTYWFDDAFTKKMFKVSKDQEALGVTLQDLVRDGNGVFSWDILQKNLEEKKLERTLFNQVERLYYTQSPHDFSDPIWMGEGDYKFLAKTLTETNKTLKNNVDGLPQLLKDGKIEEISKELDQKQKINDTTASITGTPLLSLGAWSGVSINGLFRCGALIKGWAERRVENYLDTQMSVFGKNVFQNIGDSFLNKITGNKLPLTNIYSEFNRKKESTDASEVSVYQGDYGNKDMADVWGLALDARNMYEFKACMNLLAAKGRINWYEPKLIEKINELTGDAYKLPMNVEVMLGDTMKFQAGLNAAMAALYDRDTYAGWRNQNLSAYESEMAAQKGNLDMISNTSAGLKGYLEDLIAKAKVNIAENDGMAISKDVNPIVYQAAINYAIDSGKMNAEEKMYYFMRGLALGILPPDRGPITADKYAPGIYPCFEWFAQNTARGTKPGPKDFEQFKDMPYQPDFVKWFHENIMPLDRTTTRLTKTLTQRGFAYDHDDAQALIGWSEPAGINMMLRSRGHGAMGVPPSTGLDNSAVGLTHVLDTIGNEYDAFTTKFGADRAKSMLINSLDSNGVFYAISRDKAHNKDGKSFTMPDATFNTQARADGAFAAIYGRGKTPTTTAEYMNASKDYLCMVEPDLLTPLFEGKYATQAEFDKSLSAFEARYETSIYEVYGKDKISLEEFVDNLSKLIRFIDKKDPERLKKVVAKIQADTKKRME